MAITSTVAREQDGTVQITFTIPFALIKKAQDETVSEMAKNIEVPGFRKGKAPISKAKEKIDQGTLIEHSLAHLLPKALGEAIESNKLRLAVYPKYELISAKDNEPWQIKAVSAELPEISLGDYKSIVAGEIRSASLKKEPTKEEKENVVIKALVNNIKLDIPAVLVEEEANSRLSNLLSRLEKLGLALENYLTSINKKAEDLKAEYALQAREAIALDLILNKIADDEKIEANESEVENAMKVADVKDQTPERKHLVESILRRRGALDFLISLS